MPLALPPNDPQQRGNHGVSAIGRLKAGVTLATAPSEVFGDVRPALLMLFLAVGAVLLIACANVGNLHLARSETRQKEIAIRVVLGTGRWQVVRQLLTESMILSGFGGALGIALAWALTRGLVALDPLKIPRVQDIAIDGRVLAFTAVISTVTGVVFGIVPALQSSTADLQPVLKAGGRDSRVATGWLRRVLIVSEIAASVVLVAAAMLLARSFARLLDVDAGFNAAHVLTPRTTLPPTQYTNGKAMAVAYADIQRRMRESPGVEAAGAVTGLPLASTRGDWSLVIEGDAPTSRIGRAADWQVVTPGYFEAMGTTVRAGRTFTDADRADTLPVIVINESMARKYWPGQTPLGRRLTMGPNDRWITIVGVVADVHHRGLDMDARPEMYRPHMQFRFGEADALAVPTMTWVVRTSGDPLAATSYARAAIRAVDPGLGVSDIATMEQVLTDSTSDRRLNMLLFTLLGGLALALAAVGVYGVVAYSVTQRTHEIGVRMAIGARPADVPRMVIGEGGRLAVTGVLIGSAIAIAGGRLIRGLLFNVSATDPLTFAGVAIGLLTVTLFASYIPARRATQVDPMTALRES